MDLGCCCSSSLVATLIPSAPLICSRLHAIKPFTFIELKPTTKAEKPTTKAHKPTKETKQPFRSQGLPDLPTSPISLLQLLNTARVSPLLINGDENVLITGIQHDSRLVRSGDLFVCCKGFLTDGHLHAAHAAQRGAVAIVAAKLMPELKDILTFVQVEDTNSILSALSAAFYGHPSKKLTVVGITGTNGKTTTSYLVKSMFEAMEVKTGLIGTIAYDINDSKNIVASNTTPDALSLQSLMAAMVRNDSRVCVMEVSSHALALGRCNEVDFDIAVFTNLTRDHMDFHETEQDYRECKGLLFAKMVEPLRHRKVVNMDDPHAHFFMLQGSSSVPVVRFSLDNGDADVFTSKLELSLFKTDVMVHTRVGNVHITSKLPGKHNVYNILAAVAVGVSADLPLEVIARGIEAVHGVPGRCELINEGQSFAVLVDYAHTPDALARLLDASRECGAERIISVVGCGGDRDRGKRPIMARVATDKSDICILTSDNPRTENPLSILDDMLAGVGLSMEEYLKHNASKGGNNLDNGHRLIVCENRLLAIRMAISMGKESDAVVVAGKGHEDYQIIGDKKEYFDDREECRKVLKQLGVTASNLLEKRL
eukprot:c24514_g1_i1 orf=572-2362(-)